MGFGTKRFHAWFRDYKVPSYLETYMKKYTVSYTDAEAFTTDEDIQSLTFYFLRAVPFSEIEEKNLWDKDKIDRIREWASEDTLLRLPIDRFGTTSCDIPNGHLPYLNRELKKETWKNPPKYQIGDGIHRIHVAKELGLKYIFAEVSESFRISKDEMVSDNSLVRKKY